MRSLSGVTGSYLRNVMFALIALSVTSCRNDDDDNGGVAQPTGTITVEDQTLSGNLLEVSSVTVSTSAWLVVKKVNDDNSFSDMIAEPVLINQGTRNDIEIELDNTNAAAVEIEDGDTLVLMLHADDGDGVFEYQGNTGQDMPIKNAAGNVVTETVVISSPSFEIEDQDVENNTITYTNVSTRRTGWIVVYNSTAAGAIDEDNIIGYTYLEEGNNADVVVTFEDTFTFTPGQTIFSRIHKDDPADEEFTYIDDPDTDMPESFGFGTDTTITGSTIIN
ncbi:hypothetical protein FK178_10745 [Antarcticibacterium arcticum]|uniref:DUF7282 domain-containing protein n=1 Tax=Antarcticibacterium arcticum TaxID=2585771 RepID=A0A5B8YKG6_9FLAO|nr:hypothetical protein [Antarcticibacterium arcticum]QED38165.1 hypothetical protein FK178_10745 [Antarcticibacterium arcticum]